MKSQGWKCILADRCLFVLYDEKPNSPTLGQIVGIAGLHVDDFLVGVALKSTPDLPKHLPIFSPHIIGASGSLTSLNLPDVISPSCQTVPYELTKKTM